MIDSSCVVCGEEMEDLFHLFKGCNGFRAFAFACSWEGGLMLGRFKIFLS